jgi:hypothetical protein
MVAVLCLYKAISTFKKVWVAGDGGGFWATEFFLVVFRRSEWEDVEALDFGVEAPDHIEHLRVGVGPIAADVIEVGGGEGDDSGFVEHAEEFETWGTEETVVEAGLGGGIVVGEKDDWFCHEK